MSIDGAIAMIGTANFDLRSLYLNYELALFFYSNDIASTLQRIQMRYIEESLAVDRTAWGQLSFVPAVN
jgi:cardiolipin synthase